MNQYRCETCKYAKINNRITCYCPDMWERPMIAILGDGAIGLTLIDREIDLIAHIGCASHSDFTRAFPVSLESHRQSVLDKIILDLIDEMAMGYFSTDGMCEKQRIIKKLEERRQKDGE